MYKKNYILQIPTNKWNLVHILGDALTFEKFTGVGLQVARGKQQEQNHP